MVAIGGEGLLVLDQFSINNHLSHAGEQGCIGIVYDHSALVKLYSPMKTSNFRNYNDYLALIYLATIYIILIIIYIYSC